MPVALITAIITALPQVTVGLSHLIAYIANVRHAAKQTGEWTPEMETSFINGLIQRITDPAYQPDSVFEARTPTL